MLLRLRRGYLPGAFLSRYRFSILWGMAPNPPTPPAGPPFCWQKGGKDHQRGESPLGTPTGKQTAACDCAGPKDRACLRNRSLVVPDKVPSGGFVCGVPSRGIEETAAGTQTQERHPLFGRPPGPPLRGTDLAHSRRRPKGGCPPLDFPTGKRTADCGCAGPKDGPACATALWLPLWGVSDGFDGTR